MIHGMGRGRLAAVGTAVVVTATAVVVVGTALGAAALVVAHHRRVVPHAALHPRDVAEQHLVQQHACRPPVDAVRVPLQAGGGVVLLGRHVERRADVRVRPGARRRAGHPPLPLESQPLGGAKVGQHG